jgi:1-acyl-sn-glycerol-3-phosphate acyltransferase
VSQRAGPSTEFPQGTRARKIKNQKTGLATMVHRTQVVLERHAMIYPIFRYLIQFFRHILETIHVDLFQ